MREDDLELRVEQIAQAYDGLSVALEEISKSRTKPTNAEAMYALLDCVADMLPSNDDDDMRRALEAYLKMREAIAKWAAEHGVKVEA